VQQFGKRPYCSRARAVLCGACRRECSGEIDAAAIFSRETTQPTRERADRSLECVPIDGRMWRSGCSVGEPEKSELGATRGGDEPFAEGGTVGRAVRRGDERFECERDDASYGATRERVYDPSNVLR